MDELMLKFKNICLAIACIITFGFVTLFALFFIGLSKVDALTSFYDIEDDEIAYQTLGLTGIPRGYFYGCTSSSNCSSLITGSTYTYNKVYSKSNVSLDSAGFRFDIITDTTMYTNYLYSYTALYCTGVSSAPSTRAWSGNTQGSSMTLATQYYSTYKQIDDVSFGFWQTGSTYSTINYCYYEYSVFKPNSNGAYLGIQVYDTTTRATSKHVLIGYNVEVLGNTDGLSASEVQSIVNNSATSTNSKLDSINSSVKTSESNITSAISSTESAIKSQLEESTNQIDSTLTSDSDDVESSSCGVICKLKALVRGITELPNKLVNLLLDALKSLFIPSEDELNDIIEQSTKISENFGFVGESFAFIIRLFTSIGVMIEQDGCLMLPSLNLKFGGILGLDDYVMYEDINVCMADNPWFGRNSQAIDIVRTILTGSLVCAFISFAVSQLNKILSKEDTSI